MDFSALLAEKGVQLNEISAARKNENRFSARDAARGEGKAFFLTLKRSFAAGSFSRKPPLAEKLAEKREETPAASPSGWFAGLPGSVQTAGQAVSVDQREEENSGENAKANAEAGKMLLLTLPGLTGENIKANAEGGLLAEHLAVEDGLGLLGEENSHFSPGPAEGSPGCMPAGETPDGFSANKGEIAVTAASGEEPAPAAFLETVLERAVTGDDLERRPSVLPSAFAGEEAAKGKDNSAATAAGVSEEAVHIAATGAGVSEEAVHTAAEVSPALLSKAGSGLPNMTDQALAKEQALTKEQVKQEAEKKEAGRGQENIGKGVFPENLPQAHSPVDTGSASDRQRILPFKEPAAMGEEKEPEGTDLSRQVLRQIVHSARLVSQAARTELYVQLKPEFLGHLHLKLAVENGIITAHFTAESQQVCRLLESNMNQLKQALQEQGLRFDSLQVSVGGGAVSGGFKQPEQNAFAFPGFIGGGTNYKGDSGADEKAVSHELYLKTERYYNGEKGRVNYWA